MGLLANVLFGVRTWIFQGATLPDRNYVNVQGAVTAVDDPVNNQTVLTFGGAGTSPAFNNVTANSITLGSQVPPQFVATAYPTATTTDASGLVLATIPIPAGMTVAIEATIIANLGAGNVNANLGPSVYKISTAAYRTGSAAPTVPTPTITGGVNKPFTSYAASGNIGTAAETVTGNNLLLFAFGFPAPSAWTTTTYTAGNGTTTPADFVTAGGNVYVCTSSGTASGSAPSGTGTGLGTGALFAFVCTGSAVKASWTLVITSLVTG